MKENETEPPPRPMVQKPADRVARLHEEYVLPTYARFPRVFVRGSGSYLWDTEGKRYLDLGTGIAVCCLGHAHKELAEAIAAQARTLLHISNLYYHEWQGCLAEELVQRIGEGKVFFCNSGAEANEALFKLARRKGHKEGRFEILTATNSFHGRTLAGIAATGQAKVKEGFEPLPPGFRHVPFNDLDSLEEAISPATVAVLVEGVQGEGGIHVANPEYLLELRKLCDEKDLLLLMDEVQCGQYRTGRFLSYQRLLEGEEEDFQPDGVAMAKGLGGGVPIGAIWVRESYADLLSPGSHGSTFGGNPLACAAALKVLEIVEKERLDVNARELGDRFKKELKRLAKKYADYIREVRGLGLMLGIKLAGRDEIPAFARRDAPPSIQFVRKLHERGVLAIPAGKRVVRFLPPLNLTEAQLKEGIDAVASVLEELSSSDSAS